MPFSPESVGWYVQLINVGKDVVLGAVGGLIAYLMDYMAVQRRRDSGEKVVFVFRYTSLFINMILGAFVAHIVGGVLAEDFGGYRDAVIGLSGVAAYQILELAKSRFAGWLIDKIVKK